MRRYLYVVLKCCISNLVTRAQVEKLVCQSSLDLYNVECLHFIVRVGSFYFFVIHVWPIYFLLLQFLLFH